MDPLNALATLILGKLKQSMFAEWLRFLFELGFSAIVTFLFVCGGLLAGGMTWEFAIGTAMVVAALSLTYLFRKESSRLTKGMLIVLPADEAEKELETNFQTIQKSEDKK